MALLTDWQLTGASYPGWHNNEYNGAITRNYANTIAPEAVPALIAKGQELAAHGFSLKAQPVKVFRDDMVNGNDRSERYGVNHVARFVNGEACLVVELRGAGATLEEAIAATVARNGDLYFYGDPVAGGKGQQKTCREIARRLYLAHGHLMGGGEQARVYVEYQTRAGSGGWRANTSRRMYFPAELTTEEPQRTARQSAPSIKVMLQRACIITDVQESKRVWQTGESRYVSLLPDGRIAMARDFRYTPDAEPECEGEQTWRILRYQERCWLYLRRIAEEDYQRLLAKGEKQ